MGVKEIEIKGVGDITLYTLPYCNYCNLLKDTLSKLNIPFKEIDVEENEYMGDWIERNLKIFIHIYVPLGITPMT